MVDYFDGEESMQGTYTIVAVLGASRSYIDVKFVALVLGPLSAHEKNST